MVAELDSEEADMRTASTGMSSEKRLRSLAWLSVALAAEVGVILLALMGSSAGSPRETGPERSGSEATAWAERTAEERIEAVTSLLRVVARADDVTAVEALAADVERLSAVGRSLGDDFYLAAAEASRRHWESRLEAELVAAEADALLAWPDYARGARRIYRINEHWQGALVPKRDAFRDWFRGRLLDRSDAWFGKALTRERIDGAPVLDLLGAIDKKAWRMHGDNLLATWDEGAIAFERRESKDPAARRGTLAFDAGSSEWWDYIVRAELTIDRGELRILMRLANKACAECPSYTVRVGRRGVVAGAKQRFEARLVGSRIVVTMNGRPVVDEVLPGTMSRYGTIGFAAGEGAAGRISALTVQLLHVDADPPATRFKMR